jgi:hypothetical protein
MQPTSYSHTIVKQAVALIMLTAQFLYDGSGRISFQKIMNRTPGVYALMFKIEYTYAGSGIDSVKF